jgi:hypothetical protein
MNNDKLIVKCESNTFSLNNEVKPNPEEPYTFCGGWILDPIYSCNASLSGYKWHIRFI